MLQVHKTLAICGLDCLFYEFIEEAVSHRGWRVSNLQGVRAGAGILPEIAVVFCSVGLQQILDDIRVTRSVIPKAKIVVVGFQGRDDEMLRLVEQGMYAYVPTSDGLSNFLSTLQQVLDHQVPCTGRMTQLVRNRIAELSPEQNVAAVLTHREREVLDLIAGGLSNKAIADRLGITTNTVKNHVHRLLEKLKARSRHDAAWIHSHSPRSFPTIGTIA
jgi:two-component system nitrate/nitrite response regulator NarL